jgi:hypothetical protein
MQRRLARHGECLEREPARAAIRKRELAGLADPQPVPGDLTREALESSIQRVALREALANALGGVHLQRL